MLTECCITCRRKLGKMGITRWTVRGVVREVQRWKCSECGTVTRNPDMREETGIEQRRRERLEYYQTLQDEVDRKAAKKLVEKAIEKTKPVIKINPMESLEGRLSKLNRGARQ